MRKQIKINSRNSSVELLRILAMCGVVLLHYNNPSAGAGLAYASGINRVILMYVESLFICAVDLYVLISGYFLSASPMRRMNKLLEMLIQTSVIGAGLQCVSALLSGSFSVGGVILSFIPNNYFVSLYVTMYLVSPYINMALGRLSDKGLRVLTGMILALFAVWPTAVDFLQDMLDVDLNGFMSISAYGSQSGYTLVNFLMMYLLGAYIRRNEERIRAISGWRYLLGFFTGSAIVTLLTQFSEGVAWAYCNPVVVLMACCLLAVFLKWNYSSVWVNRLAKSAFTCYLVHGVLITRISVEQAVQASLPAMLGHMLVSVVGIYAVCHVCYLIWNIVTGPFFRVIEKKCEKWDRLLTPDTNV